MDPITLEHVCALAAEAAHDVPVLHAKEWASRLGLPLEILDLADLDFRAETFVRGHSLCVFSNELPRPVQERLLRCTANVQESAILVSARSSGPVSRALIVHYADYEESNALSSALSLCGLLQAVPVILTTAPTEAAARHGRQIAEAACLRHRTPAYLDYVVGMDLRSAVDSIARWRRCSHVFLTRRRVTSWWNRAGADILELLLKSADSLNLLALPERGVLFPTGAAPRRARAESVGAI